MLMTPQMSSVRPVAVIPIPAGLVVGYEDTVASLAAYPDWDLCDGTAGTPDLSDRFIIGTGGGYSLGDTGGATTGQVAGSTSTDGGHGSIGGLGGNSGPSSRSGTGGAHAHSVAADMDWLPPSRQLVFIKSNTETRLPPNAVAWRYDAAEGAGFGVFADAGGRMLVGRTDDARAQVGADNRNVTSVAVLLDGGHVHPTSIASAGSPSPHANREDGAHVHPDAPDEVVAVPKPPYLVLLCINAYGAAGASSKLVAAYDGLTASLPAGWYLCDGANGTPNMAGRIPLGKDGASAIGDIGGSLATVPVTGGAVPSFGGVHNHSDGDTTLSGSAGDHSDYTWTHNHASWSGDAEPTPPYHCLHYVMYSGV